MIYLIDMRANGTITHSDRNSPRDHAQVNRRAGPPPQRDGVVVRELNKARTEALRLIDESAFSCVATSSALVLFPISPPPLAHRAPLQLVSFESMPGHGYWLLHGRVSSRLLLIFRGL